VGDKLKEVKEIHIKNRRAAFEFFFLDKFTAGIQLLGTEIKSIREGKASITEAYCYIDKGELWIKGMHISPYIKASFYNHEETRNRKLLLHKRELKKLENKLDQGVTIIPLSLFITSRGWAKMDIALAKGKKTMDKRETIKRRELERTMGRKIK
jgi:SsrA-binding protein